MGQGIKFAAVIVAVGLAIYAISFLMGEVDRGPTSMDLEIVPNELLFDSVPYQGTAQKTLEMTNRANYPIRVKDVTGSCGCLQLNFTPRTLKPGESMTVPVQMSGRTKAGLSGGTVTVYSSSVTNSYHVIPAKTHEIRGIALVPEVLDFGRQPPDRLPFTIPFKVIVNGNDSSAAQNVQIQCDSTNVQIAPQGVDENGDAKFDITLIAGDAVGHLNAELSINVPGFDSVFTNAVGVIDAPIKAVPPTLLLTRNAPKRTQLRNSTGQTVPIRSVEYSDSLKSVISGRAGDGFYEFTTTPEATPARKVIHGTIILNAEGSSTKIRVPVTWIRGR